MRPRPLVASLAALAAFLAPAASAFSHEHRHVGRYELVVGWVEEPPYAEFKNGVQVRITDDAGKPVVDLGDSLRVEVVYNRQKSDAGALAPAFGERSGRQGEYWTPVIPTRPGTYTFHLTGTIRDQRIDESFTASESTFDLVRKPAEIEVPAPDPTRAELAARIQRMGPRLEAMNEALDTVRAVAVAGLGIGGLGLVAAMIAVRRRRSR